MSLVFAQMIKRNVLDAKIFSDARQERFSSGRSIQDILIAGSHIKEEDLLEEVQNLCSVQSTDLDGHKVDPRTIKLIRSEDALRYAVFPLKIEGHDLTLAMSDPSDIIAKDEIAFVTGLDIRPVLAGHGQLSRFIQKYYVTRDSVQEILKDTIDDAGIEKIDEERMTSEEIADAAVTHADNSSFIRLVNRLLCDAVDARASDIHIEPREGTSEVRYRIDGYLRTVIKVPRQLHPRLAARIKILAKLDIAEQRKVQEGRIKVSLKGEKIDLRISVIPIFHGEKIVMRILDNRSTQFDIHKIGFSDDELEMFRGAISRNQGVVLVTGPTGSGKTTTLYAALQHIKCETKNIVTIEDPIEYLIDGINQLQLSRFKDVTFTNGLRSILRQDPDVILVGEIRDKETAEIAFRASLTGHLVFSTLHTNSAVSSITRLLNIGLESYLIASSVSLLVAQRLVRLICPECKEEYPPDPELMAKFKGYFPGARARKFYRGRGCDHCGGSGFYGRSSIFEIMKIDDKIRDLIFHKASETVILKQALNNGMRTLVESGVAKVMAGMTTLDEIAKVTDITEQHADAGDLLEQFDKIVKDSTRRSTETSYLLED